MGVQVPELKQCVQSFHFIVLSSSLSSLLVLCFYLGKFFFSLSSAPSKVRLGFAMTISLPRFSLLFLAPNKTPSDEETLFSSSLSSSSNNNNNNRYMDKKLKLKLNGNRGVIGILRGFDQFLNLVLDECVNDSTAEKTPLGMVVVRGASVLSMEALEHIAPVQRKSVM
jgi:small nuclear ribonucleoprotein G